MNQDFIIFVRKGEPNDLRNKPFVVGKTVEQIANDLGLTNEILAIVTTNYRVPLDPQLNLLEKYPELILTKRPEKFERTNPYIAIVPIEEKNTITINVDVQAQEGVDFPYFEATLNLDDLAGKNADALETAINSFLDVPHTDDALLCNGEPIDKTKPAAEYIEIAKTQRLTLKAVFGQKELGIFEHRSKLLKEMADTENTYIQTLNRLTEFWKPNVLLANIISSTEAEEMFKHFPVISACHTRFYMSLQQAGYKFPAQVATCLLNFSEFFKTCSYYIGTYKVHTSLLAERTKNPAIQEKMNEIELKNPFNTAETLASCLITPVQRMPRYILLIRELIKKTPKCHPDYTLLITSEHYIDQVTREIEKKADHAEQNQKMIELERRLTNRSMIIFSETRQIEYTWDVTINKTYQGKIYLLTDLLLINTVEKKGETVQYYSMLKDHWMYPIDSNKILFYNDNSPSEKVVVQFSSQQQHDEFTTKLQVQCPQPVEGDVIFSPLTLRNALPAFKSCACAEYKGTIYLFGGYVDGSLSGALYMLKPAMKTITRIDTPVSPRFEAACAIWHNKLFIFGGHGGDFDYPKDLWSYNLLTSTWEQHPPAPLATSAHSMNAANKRLFVFGGYKSSKFRNTMMVYDTERSIWHSAIFEGAPEPRAYHSSTIMGDSIIILGGKNKEKMFNDVHFFDTKKIYWRQTGISYTNFGMRCQHSVITLKSSLLVFGGSSKEKIDQCVLIDTHSKSGKAINLYGHFPRKIANTHVVKVADDTIWVIGGGGALDDSKDAFQTGFSVLLTKECLDTPEAIPDYFKKGALTRTIIRKAFFQNNVVTPELFGSIMQSVKKRARTSTQIKEPSSTGAITEQASTTAEGETVSCQPPESLSIEIPTNIPAPQKEVDMTSDTSDSDDTNSIAMTPEEPKPETPSQLVPPSSGEILVPETVVAAPEAKASDYSDSSDDEGIQTVEFTKDMKPITPILQEVDNDDSEEEEKKPELPQIKVAQMTDEPPKEEPKKEEPKKEEIKPVEEPPKKLEIPAAFQNNQPVPPPAAPKKEEPKPEPPKPVEVPQPVIKEEPKPIEQPKPVEPPKPVEQSKPVEQPKPVEVPQPVVKGEPKPVVKEEPKPVEQPKPVEPPKPVGQPKPIEQPKEEPKPVVKEEPKPVEPAKPDEQPKPVEEPKPVVKEEPKPVVKEEPKPAAVKQEEPKSVGKSEPQRPQLRSVSQKQITPPVQSDEDNDPIFADLGVSISGLATFQKRVIMRKITALKELRQQNEVLRNQLEIERNAKNGQSETGSVPVYFKVFCNSQVKVIKRMSDIEFSALCSDVQQLTGKNASNAKISKAKVPFTSDNLANEVRTAASRFHPIIIEV